MDYNATKTRFWYHLLPGILGSMLLVQACSASLHITTNGVTPNIYLGDSVIVKGDVNDDDYPGVAIQNAPVEVVVTSDSGISQHLHYNTTALGKVLFVYTPQRTGNYTIDLYISVNYNTIPGLPASGVQQAHGHTNILHVNPKFVFHPVTTLGPIVLLTTSTTTAAPVTTTQTAQQTTAQTTQVTQITQATQVTQVTQVTHTTSAVPAVSAATAQPVTSPAQVQQSPPGTMGTEETLTTAPTPVAAPADIPSYPVPLWLVALIIFILLVAIGGGLYLKSQLGNEEQKK